jgi:guanylate kinase
VYAPPLLPFPLMSSHRLPTDTDNGLLLIISGPSGVGKTTVTKGVERGIPGAVYSVSHTTRPPTSKEVEGVDYHFVTDEEFERTRAAGQFLESAGIYGKKYGTPRAPVEEQLRRGRLMILEIDVQGAIQVKEKMPQAFGIYILPPSDDELLRRLRDRKREDDGKIQQRFNAAKEEIAAAKACNVYDVFLVNDNLDNTIKAAVDCVTSERTRRVRG